MKGLKMARALGWFSIALGLAEVLRPRKLAVTLHRPSATRLLQMYGLREIITGVGILSRRHPEPWVWARIAGDLVDLATLRQGMSVPGARKPALLASAAVAGVTALDVVCSGRLASRRQLVAINRPPVPGAGV